MKRNIFRVAAPLFAAFLLWISSAGAVPMQLAIASSSSGACFNSGVVAGPTVSFNGACGTFVVNNVVGTSTGLPSLDLGSTNAANIGTDDLTILLFAFGLTSPIGLTSWLATFTGSWILAHSGTLVTSQEFVNGIALPLLSSSTTPFTLSATTAINGLTGPYNLEMIITIHSTGPNVFTLDENLVGTQATGQVPEPATLALLGVGLAGLGFSRRRKTN